MRSLAVVLLLVAPLAYGAPLVAGPIRVAEDGTVSDAGRRVGKLPLPAAPLKLEHRRVTASGRALLHVIVHGKGGRSAELVAEAGAVAPLFAGATGAQGKDGEWSRHLRVDGSGVILFERREGAVRCDGSPVFLFPRLYDFAQARFRPVSPVVRPLALVEVNAARRAPGAPRGAPLNAFSLRFASTQAGDEGSAENLGAPREAEDGDPATGWSEGMGGAGVGEFLSAQSPSTPYGLRAIRIIPGDASSARAFREANRLKSALLLLGPEQRYRVRFPRDPLHDEGAPGDPYWAILPAPVATTCATLVIEAVYPGTSARGGSGGRTAIAELRFFTELEFQGGLAQLARDLDGTDDARGKAAVTILRRLGREGVTVAGREIALAPAHALPRRLAVLLEPRIPEAAEPLAALVPRLGPHALTAAIEGLVALGAHAVEPIIARLAPSSALGGPARAALLRALGRIGGERARAALLARAGIGPDEIRAATVEGLGALGAEDLEPVLGAAAAAGASPRRQADLVHALGRLGRGNRAGVARRLGALYAATTDFEVRYRILASLGRLDPDAGLATLALAAGDPDPILRWHAVEQLRLARDAGAVPLLRRALDDRHPPVRASAAIALLGRPRGDGEVGRALARRLDAERWTFVLAATAEALGAHCVPEGNAALRRAVATANAGFDLRALLSLARCAPPGLGAELVALGRDRARRTPIRVRALSLLGAADARKELDALIPLASELRDGAARSEGEEVVAVAALRAIALAGGARAADALADALALDPHETIRTAAALGLGQLCAGAETLRRAAERDSASGVRRAAQGALRRCKLR